VQRLLHFAGLAPTHLGQRASPEHLADHGGVLEQSLAVGAQGVEAGGDQRLHRVGDSPLADEPAAVGEQAHELLRVERVAACALEESLLRLRRQHRPLEQRSNQAGRLLIREWGEVDPLRVAGVRAEGGVLLVQLRAGGAEDEQRHPLRPVSQVLEEGEHRLVRPVQVLEDEDRLPLLRPRLERAAPSGEGLLLRGGLRGSAHKRRQTGPEPGPVGIRLGEGVLELRLRLLRGIGLQDPALRLDDLPERPESDPLAVGQAAALAPAGEPGAVVEGGEELGHKPALAHPRLAHDRHQLAGALLRGALEDAGQERLFELAADERGGVGTGDVRAEAGAWRERAEECERLRLSFRLHRLELLVLEDALGCAIRLLRDRDPVHRGGALQPRGGVDDVAGHDPLALLGTRAESDDCLARVDPDPHL
jgi:hypothetical protein